MRTVVRPPAFVRGPRCRAGRALAALAVVAAVLLGPIGSAGATWSIIAVDPDTGLVGGAMASCVPASVLGDPDQALVPLVLVPGQAVGIAQGTVEPEILPRFRQLLTDGIDAADTVAALVAEDDQPAVRQYAVLTLADGGAAVAFHSGGQVEPGSGVVEGEQASAQGVLLADAGAVSSALGAYRTARTEGRSLDRALADALMAGSRAGGDRRCPEDQTALFAHLAVAEPDDDGVRPSLLLTVTVDEGDGQNPVLLLDRALEEGRTGWIDAGLDDPAGVSRTLVLAVGVGLAVAAVVIIRRGMGSPSARRRSG